MSPPWELSARKILIVDDEELSRVAVRKLLSRLFPSMLIVGEAVNGKAATEAAFQLKPEIIIMDVKLPLMNGLEAAAVIKSREAWMKVIMLSAHDSFGFAQQAVNSGMDGYLLKPVTESEFREVLVRVLESMAHHEKAPPMNPSRYPWEAEEAFLRSLSHYDKARIQAAGHLLAQQLEAAFPEFRNFQEACGELGTGLRRTLVRVGAPDSIAARVDLFLISVHAQGQFPELRSELLDLIDSIAEGLSARTRESPQLKIHQSIHDTPWSELSLETVAGKLGMSPPYLSKVFKDLFGKKFVDYVTDLKLEEAQRLFQLETRTVAEVCHRLGWSDAAHFSRLFKDKTGQSPKAWLRTHR